MNEDMTIAARIRLLAAKMISYKTAVLVMCLVLLINGYMDQTGFLTVLLTVIAGREGQKIAEKFAGSTETGG